MQLAPTLKIIDSVGDELAVRVSVPGAWIQFCENFAGQLGSGSGPLQKLNHGLRLGIRLFAIDPACQGRRGQTRWTPRPCCS